MLPSLVEFISLAALFVGVVLIALGSLKLWQGRAAPKTEPAAPQDIAELVKQSEERIAHLLVKANGSHLEKLDSLYREVEAIKSDIDWMAGERMIEQAISMARDGVPAEEISSELCLSLDAAQTLSTIRRH